MVFISGPESPRIECVRFFQPEKGRSVFPSLPPPSWQPFICDIRSGLAGFYCTYRRAEQRRNFYRKYWIRPGRRWKWEIAGIFFPPSFREISHIAEDGGHLKVERCLKFLAGNEKLEQRFLTGVPRAFSAKLWKPNFFLFYYSRLSTIKI